MTGATPRIRVGQSPVEVAKLLLIALALVAMNGFLVSLGGARGVVGWLGLAVFVPAAIVLVHRAARLRGPVLTVDASAIHDVRVSRRPLPWSAVRDVGVVRLRGQQFLVLQVDDAVWGQIGVHPLPRLARRPNRALGPDGLYFTVQTLPITFATLVGAARAYAPRASGG